MTIVYLSSLFIFNLFTTSQNEEMVQIRGKYEWLIDLCTVFISPTQKKEKKILENPMIYQARKISSKCIHGLKIIQMVSSKGKEYWGNP